jgi:hypothetical protein
MTKQEILSELDIISAIAEVNDNILICNKVKRIQEALTAEWDANDIHYEEFKKHLSIITNTQTQPQVGEWFKQFKNK